MPYFTGSCTTNHTIASCDPPLPPIGGYILTTNTSTIEGAMVTYVCSGNREKIAICTEIGQWEPNSSSICEETTKPSGTHGFMSLIDNRIIIVSQCRLI